MTRGHVSLWRMRALLHFRKGDCRPYVIATEDNGIVCGVTVL